MYIYMARYSFLARRFTSGRVCANIYIYYIIYIYIYIYYIYTHTCKYRFECRRCRSTRRTHVTVP